MIMYEQDPDVVRWGLHLLDVSRTSNGGSPSSTIHYEWDLSQVESVSEGYCERKCNELESDEIIAHAFQEELSRLAAAEASGFSHGGEEHLQASILAQDWRGLSKRYCSVEHENDQRDVDERRKSGSCSSTRENSPCLEDKSYLPEIADESVLDGEVGKRLNQMVPIPHVPKTNGEIPSADEEISDHQRLLESFDDHLQCLIDHLQGSIDSVGPPSRLDWLYRPSLRARLAQSDRPQGSIGSVESSSRLGRRLLRV
ncbi:cysteine proteinases superfamily protein [Actinidia rufa]|uniref:Cysteine proteinases superfamily protein n=1 Tax=Actinidia rufa TaxID=165716 RepID=A0A7J0GVG8_9ERIC|nr:cysteine proteinases superfamily protein [Actinidia rufa]